jgi:hypothetical protein
MGLLDGLLGAKLGGIVEEALGKVTEAAEEIKAEVEQKYGDVAGAQRVDESGAVVSSATTASAPADGEERKDAAFFADVLASEFGQYVVRTNVPVSDLGGTGRPYDFGLFAHGECCGVVVLVEHNRDRNRAYLGSKEAAAAEGVPFINFYLHMPNERAFVVDRIRRLAKP